MSNVSHGIRKPPTYDKKGKRSFEMFVMTSKSLLHNVGYGAVLNSRFHLMLLATEGMVLDLTKNNNKSGKRGIASNL